MLTGAPASAGRSTRGRLLRIGRCAVSGRRGLLAVLDRAGVTVRATPVTQQQGVLFYLPVSLAPFVLLILFHFWLFRRQRQALGGGLFGGGRKKPVDPGSVRITFDDVAGIDEAEVRRITDDCCAGTRRFLRENRNRLDAIVEQLLEHETFGEQQVYAAGTPRPTGEQPASTVPA